MASSIFSNPAPPTGVYAFSPPNILGEINEYTLSTIPSCIAEKLSVLPPSSKILSIPLSPNPDQINQVNFFILFWTYNDFSSLFFIALMK